MTTATTEAPRTTLSGFAATGLFLGGAIGYLLGAIPAILTGAVVGAFVGAGLVLLAYRPLPHDPDEPPAADHDHPNYIAVWAGLFALTMAEVAVAFVALPKQYIIAALVLIAIWKALLVALYYMHLKYEPQRVWMLAASPLPLAVILVFAVLAEGW